jgi:hypothetical protein
MLKIAVELLTKPSKKTRTAKLIQEADQEGKDDQETPKCSLGGHCFFNIIGPGTCFVSGWLLFVASVICWMLCSSVSFAS